MKPPDERFGITTPLAAVTDISGSALRLYIMMASFAGRDRIARPGQDRIARELGWMTGKGAPDRRRVYKCQQELIAADLVRVAGQHSLGNHQWVRKYLVAPFPQPKKDAYPVDASSPGEDASVSNEDASISARGCVPNGRALIPVVLHTSRSSETTRSDERLKIVKGTNPSDDVEVIAGAS